MQRPFLIAGLIVALLLAAFWAVGGFAELQLAAISAQRAFQDAMAGALRRLRAHQPGALAALMGVAFTYGVFHAAGPGHGKVLIGGYGVSRRVRLLPLLGIALAAALAQATTAVALVYAGVLLLDLSRDRMIGLTEQALAPLSYAAVGLVGLWLVLRGGSRLWRRRATEAGHNHDGHEHRHDHEHDHPSGDGAHCGHAHGPTLDEVAAVHSWRDAAVLVASVALRPCSGALLLLILTWQLHIAAAGIAGAYAMGLGTASITLAVALLSVWAREGALASIERLAGAEAALPVIEIAAGAVVALAAAQLLLAAL